jgi:hypothetical protein
MLTFSSLLPQSGQAMKYSRTSVSSTSNFPIQSSST